jgi:hypothetical protein
VAPDTSYTFPDVAADHTLSAAFATDLFPVTVAAVGGGTVTKDPDLTSYAYGTSVELTATAGAGWAFASWSGDTSGTADSLALTVTRARSVTATFVDVAAPQVAVGAPVGGEAWLEGSGQAITWTATDNAGGLGERGLSPMGGLEVGARAGEHGYLRCRRR